MKLFTSIVLVLLLTSAILIINAPPEITQGLVHKIFYIHVASAFAMYVGFACGAVGSFMYLLRRQPSADALAVAGVEVGVVLCSSVLVTGPIWARPIWGVWWTWDARLTSTLFCWLIFVSVLLIRRAITDPSIARKISAAVTLLGVIDIPIIIFAVKLWRGAHPSVLGQQDSMPWSMRLPLIVTMIAILALTAWLIRLRYLIERSRNA